MNPNRSPFRLLSRSRAAVIAASMLAGAPIVLPWQTTEALAQERPFWEQDGAPAPRTARPRRDDAYNAPPSGGPPGGFGQQADVTGRPYGAQTYGGSGYDSQAYGSGPPQQPVNPRQIRPYDQGGYSGPSVPPGGAPPYGGGADSYGGQVYVGAPPGSQQPNDAYRPGGAPPAYQPGYAPDGGGYGQPYAPPPNVYAGPDGGPPPPAYRDDGRYDERRGGGTYSQNEVVDAGHRFFGSVSQGIARAVESVFKRQGRPNGYILGEDAGGAFVAGLRYGEGMLSTKDAGTHKVYWQGPSLGYDFGGEGSKTMVLVYNLRDPSDIYNRFGGVQGSAYLIGGVSVQFQALDGITLAVIRSGVGLRLGANVGYLKYTRRPTWNPF